MAEKNTETQSAVEIEAELASLGIADLEHTQETEMFESRTATSGSDGDGGPSDSDSDPEKTLEENHIPQFFGPPPPFMGPFTGSMTATCIPPWAMCGGPHWGHMPPPPMHWGMMGPGAGNHPMIFPGMGHVMGPRHPGCHHGGKGCKHFKHSGRKRHDVHKSRHHRGRCHKNHRKECDDEEMASDIKMDSDVIKPVSDEEAAKGVEETAELPPHLPPWLYHMIQMRRQMSCLGKCECYRPWHNARHHQKQGKMLRRAMARHAHLDNSTEALSPFAMFTRRGGSSGCFARMNKQRCRKLRKQDQDTQGPQATDEKCSKGNQEACVDHLSSQA